MSGRRRKQQKSRQNMPARRAQPPVHGTQARAARANAGSLEYAERTYVGPLPEPADLQAYDLIVPGAAERIVSAFERQSAHRQELEQTVVSGSERRAGLGQWLAFVVLMSGVIGGSVVAVAGDGVAGASIAGAAFAGGALSYIIGGRAPKQQ